MAILPTDITGGDQRFAAFDHAFHHNTLHGVHNAGVELGVRYVRTSGGSDANNGRSWEQAKATVAAAASSLPQSFGGAMGRIILGPGNHNVSAPIVFSHHFVIGGLKPTVTQDTGDRATVVGTHNGHVFASIDEGSDNSWHHGVRFHDMMIKGRRGTGNTATNSQPNDLIHMSFPGHVCSVERVRFQEAERHAIFASWIENLYMYNISSNWIETSAVKVDNTAPVGAPGAGVLGVWGWQADFSGKDCIIDYESGSSGSTPNGHVVLSGLTCETINADQPWHRRVVKYTPHTASTRFTLIGVADFAGVGGTVDAFFHEIAGSGTGYATVAMINCTSTRGHNKMFLSAPRTKERAGTSVIVGGIADGAGANWVDAV